MLDILWLTTTIKPSELTGLTQSDSESPVQFNEPKDAFFKSQKQQDLSTKVGGPGTVVITFFILSRISKTILSRTMGPALTETPQTVCYFIDWLIYISFEKEMTRLLLPSCLCVIIIN